MALVEPNYEMGAGLTFQKGPFKYKKNQKPPADQLGIGGGNGVGGSKHAGNANWTEIINPQMQPFLQKAGGIPTPTPFDQIVIPPNGMAHMKQSGGVVSRPKRSRNVLGKTQPPLGPTKAGLGNTAPDQARDDPDINRDPYELAELEDERTYTKKYAKYGLGAAIIGGATAAGYAGYKHYDLGQSSGLTGTATNLAAKVTQYFKSPEAMDVDEGVDPTIFNIPHLSGGGEIVKSMDVDTPALPEDVTNQFQVHQSVVHQASSNQRSISQSMPAANINAEDYQSVTDGASLLHQNISIGASLAETAGKVLSAAGTLFPTVGLVGGALAGVASAVGHGNELYHTISTTGKRKAEDDGSRKKKRK